MQRLKIADSNWNRFVVDLPRSFARLHRHFPHLDPLAIPRVTGTRAMFEAYLADRHDLTVIEAHDVMEEFLTCTRKPDNSEPLRHAA